MQSETQFSTCRIALTLRGHYGIEIFVCFGGCFSLQSQHLQFVRRLCCAGDRPLLCFDPSAGECRSRHDRRSTAARRTNVVPMVCTEPAELYECEKSYVTISNERAFGYAKTPVVSSVKTMPASCICDDAVYAVTPGVSPGLGTSLYVKKGSSYFVLHVYGFPDQTKAMAMEKTLALQACSKL